jgi:UDP-GlcNAc:undecaprenyl-phosphate/decaprenyl-phosphate GlcNAc-1-phosphate transferase
MINVWPTYTTAFLAAFFVTLLLTPWVRTAATRLGMVDVPGERRPHQRPTARGGGLAVVLGVHLALLGVLLFSNFDRLLGFDLKWWMGFWPASLVLLVVGLIDDRRGMSPLTKLSGQVLAAVLVWLSGTRFGNLFGAPLPELVDAFLVVFWIVAVINAFNLIDGMDGLASGLAIVSSVGLCGVLVHGGQFGAVTVLVALSGACLAFLRYNFHPATIFLGDTGSMFLGLTLGVVSLQSFTKNTFFLSLTIPILVLGVPIYDSALAVWRRSVRRALARSAASGSIVATGILQGDVDHLHHRLVKSGFSTRRAAVVLYAINGVMAAFALLMVTFQSRISGIFLLALLGATYVLLRHMAVIELRDTGKMLLAGLRRPTHSLLKALAYPVWDLVCLGGGLAAAMWLGEGKGSDFWHRWFLDLPVWVTPTFSFLVISRVYITVWTRARVLDLLLLLLTLQGGLILGLAVALVIDPYNVVELTVRALLFGAISHAGIVAVRLVYRCTEEVVQYLRSPKNSSSAPERILLYGAGGRCQLFLRERGFNESRSFDGRCIVGLIDDEPSLHFKWVNGLRVLGGGADLAQIVARHRITGIVTTAILRPEAVQSVRKEASELGLHLSEWCIQEVNLLPMKNFASNRDPEVRSSNVSP